MEGLREQFFTIIKDVEKKFRVKIANELLGKNLPPLEMLVQLEKILFARKFDDEIVAAIISFIKSLKVAVKLKKVKIGNDMPSEDSYLAAEFLGSFVPQIPAELTNREHYLPFWLYPEAPYHKISLVDGKINFTYEENTPVIAIPIFNGVKNRPNAMEYILWSLRKDAREKMIRKIRGSEIEE